MNSAASNREHWRQIYANRPEDELSWFQSVPTISLDFLLASDLHKDAPNHGDAPIHKDAPIIDIGGGTSRLVDALLHRGFTQLTVLDIAPEALQKSQIRLAGSASQVSWLAADITEWEPDREYQVWHDRAVFHFLTTEPQRRAYRATLEKAIAPGGIVVIGTFALDGPERCSGLSVERYSSETLAVELGPAFRRVASRQEKHITPAGHIQHFQFSQFLRNKN